MAARKHAKTRRTKRKTSPARSKRIDLTEASPRARAAVAADIRRVLAKHRIRGTLTEVRVEPGAAAAARVAPAAATAASVSTPCGPGEVRRVVCFFRKGTFVCEERCVPV